MGRRPHPRNAAGQKSSYPRLYGRHAVFAALDNPERVFRKLHVTHETAKEIVIPRGLAIQYGDAADLGRLVPADAPHQGFVLEVEPLDDVWLGDLLAAGADDRRPLVVLDQVTDPHNVGAILRSAAAFGALGLVTQDRHAPPESGALARAASGALESVPWARVVNLARALDEIGEAGFWRIGLDGVGGGDARGGARRHAAGAGARSRRRGPARQYRRALRRDREAADHVGDGEPERVERRGGRAVCGGAAGLVAGEEFGVSNLVFGILRQQACMGALTVAPQPVTGFVDNILPSVVNQPSNVAAQASVLLKPPLNPAPLLLNRVDPARPRLAIFGYRQFYQMNGGLDDMALDGVNLFAAQALDFLDYIFYIGQIKSSGA